MGGRIAACVLDGGTEDEQLELATGDLILSVEEGRGIADFGAPSMSETQSARDAKVISPNCSRHASPHDGR